MTSETSRIRKTKSSNGKQKDKASDEPPKKRGPHEKFTGLRYDFMMGHFQSYIDPDKPFKHADVAAEYWTRVSWRDHNLRNEVDEDTFLNALVPPDEDGSLTDEELAQKTKVMAEMQPVSPSESGSLCSNG